MNEERSRKCLRQVEHIRGSFVTQIFHNGQPNVVNHLGKRYFSLKNICVFTKLRSLKSKTIQINEATEKGNPHLMVAKGILPSKLKG